MAIPTSLTIEITTDDIVQAEGQAGVYNRCPAALALGRQGLTEIDIDEDRALWTQGSERFFAKTSRDLSIFIDDFDNNQPVQPAIFTMTEIRLAAPQDERIAKTWDDDYLVSLIEDGIDDADDDSLDIDLDF